MAKSYKYKARDRSGQLFTGHILADNEVAVAIYIQGKDHFVIQIKEEKGVRSLKTMVESWQRVNSKEIAVTCRQFSTMLDAGVSLVSCLHILIEQTDNLKLKTALQGTYKKIKEGETLARAMRDYPAVFPLLMINMVEVGEVGGVLDIVLARMATHFEKEYKLNEKVKSAMMYPAMVLSMAFLTVLFMLVFVLPTFNQMFMGMKVDLPVPTRMILALSTFLRHYGFIVVGGGCFIVYSIVIVYQQQQRCKSVDWLIFRVPIFGILLKKIAIARFSRTLSTLLHGGVPIIIALEVVKKTIAQFSMHEALTKAQSRVSEGVGLAATLANSEVFTPMAVQMIAIGEESGTLDKLLGKIADFYEDEVDDMVGRLSSLMEPLIIVVLGCIIGFIVISVALPLFDITTSIGNL